MSVNTLLNYPPGSWEQFWGRSWSASEFLNTQGITNAHRDSLIATDGMIIYNSDNNAIEGYINGSWQSLATTSQLPSNNSSHFLARRSGSTQDVNSSDTIVIFQIVEQNVTNGSTGNYNNTTGIYTIPFDGVYQFNVQVGFYCTLGTFSDPYIVITGLNTVSVTYDIGTYTYTGFATQKSLVGSGCGHFSAGDQVRVYISATGLNISNTLSILTSYFSGCLIKAD